MSDHTPTAPSLQPETKLIPLTQGKFAIVDAADYDWLMQWKWCAAKYRRTWYARRAVVLPDGKRTTVKMHRVILMVSNPNIDVDHKDGDGLNNRRNNLREATTSQNQQNKGARSDNTSGRKGVTWQKERGKWRAQIFVGGKTIHLGSFVSLDAAADAYDDAARKFYGEFARPNNP